jgi:hypothetical protein
VVEHPVGGAVVQLGDQAGVAVAEARPQQVGEQGVVAVPAALGDVGEEHAAALQGVEALLGVGVVGEDGRQPRGQPVDHARAEQELLGAVVLAVEHLLEEVLGHRGFGGGGAEHDLVAVVGLVEGAGGQAQARDPALGAMPEGLDVVAAQLDAVGVEQGGGLVEAELEVGVADLAEAAVHPQAPEGDRRVGPGAQHHGHGGGGAVQHVAQGLERLGRAQLVGVVEHEDPRAAGQRGERLVEHVGRGPAAAAGCVGHGRDPGEGAHDRPGEPAGLVVPGVEGDPRGLAVGRAEPGGDEGGLAGARQTGHEGDVAPVAVVEQVLQPSAGDERARQRGDRVAGGQALWGGGGHVQPPGGGVLG